MKTIIYTALTALTLSAQQEPLDWKQIDAWAQKDTPSPAFTRPALQAFLEARKSNFLAANTTIHKTWLQELVSKGNLHLKSWALTRLVEVGDFTKIQELDSLAGRHLIASTKPMSGRDKDIVLLAPMPHLLGGTFQMDPRSPYLQAMANSLGQDPVRAVSPGMYAIWSRSLQASHRPLILEIAKFIEPKAASRTGVKDAWLDPRYWIVRDWLAIYGDEEHFKSVINAIKDVPTQKVVEKALTTLKGTEGHWERRAAHQALLTSGTTTFLPDVKPTYRPLPPSPARPNLEQLSPSSMEELELFVIRNRILTTVEVDLLVGTKGEILLARPVPGHFVAPYTPLTLRWAYSFKFQPYMENNTPIPFRTRVSIPYSYDFRLPERR